MEHLVLGDYSTGNKNIKSYKSYNNSKAKDVRIRKVRSLAVGTRLYIREGVACKMLLFVHVIKHTQCCPYS